MTRSRSNDIKTKYINSVIIEMGTWFKNQLIKDRQNKERGGNNMPWGKGDTPLKEILTLLKEKKYTIPATIELEYDVPAGSDPVKEVKICMEYAKAILS